MNALNVLLATAPSTIGYDDFKSIIANLSAQISVSTIVTVIGAIIAITVAIGFAWWGARYGTRKLMGALKGGKVTV